MSRTTTSMTAGPAAGPPVLAELPELAHVLERLSAADRALASALDTLIALRGSGLVEAATGVDVEAWLSIVARRTATDRRMLVTAADVCRRLPHLHRAFSEGALSWAQLRHIVCQVHRLPVALDERLDSALVGAVEACADLEPDALLRMVRWVLVDLAPDEPAEDAPVTERLVLQPRLDGTGGAVHGELGAVGFAALDAATAPGPSPEPAATRASRLTDLCLRRSRDAEGPTDVHMLLRVELETLLGLVNRPGQLLTTLAGGAMWTDAAMARQLAAEAGSMRLIVTDRGAPAGVGRRRREPPEWLREAILALHDTCTEPGCPIAARTCDVDHARPGVPAAAPTSATSDRCACPATAAWPRVGGPSPRPPTGRAPGTTRAAGSPPGPHRPPDGPAPSPRPIHRVAPATADASRPTRRTPRDRGRPGDVPVRPEPTGIPLPHPDRDLVRSTTTRPARTRAGHPCAR